MPAVGDLVSSSAWFSDIVWRISFVQMLKGKLSGRMLLEERSIVAHEVWAVLSWLILPLDDIVDDEGIDVEVIDDLDDISDDALYNAVFVLPRLDGTNMPDVLGLLDKPAILTVPDAPGILSVYPDS